MKENFRAEYDKIEEQERDRFTIERMFIYEVYY
jgi:hypothetical protein